MPSYKTIASTEKSEAVAVTAQDDVVIYSVFFFPADEVYLFKLLTTRMSTVRLFFI